MAIPATILAGLAKAATDKAVQAAALRLGQDVYGRILSNRKTEPAKSVDPLRDLAPMVAQLATKEEVAAAFSILQAEVDRRHRRAFRLLLGVGALQLVAIVLLLAR